MAQKSRPAAPPMPKGQSYMFVMMMLMLLLFINPGITTMLGQAMGVVLTPAIGFGGRQPVLSILFAGLITGLLSTVLRHFTTDYVGLERGRILQRTFNKELMEARANRDVDRVDRLRRAQPFLMSHTMSAQYQTMKPAVYTMIVALAVYGWVNHLLTSEVHTSAVSLPWSPFWPLGPGSIQMMFLYAVMSLPATLVASNVLRLWKFRNFDPSAKLPPVPTVQELVRRAEGQLDDEDTVKREADKARRRIKGEGAAAAADDDEPVIEDTDDEDLEIVEGGEGEAGGPEEGRPAKAARLAPDKAAARGAVGEEE